MAAGACPKYAQANGAPAAGLDGLRPCAANPPGLSHFGGGPGGGGVGDCPAGEQAAPGGGGDCRRPGAKHHDRCGGKRRHRRLGCPSGQLRRFCHHPAGRGGRHHRPDHRHGTDESAPVGAHRRCPGGPGGGGRVRCPSSPGQPLRPGAPVGQGSGAESQSYDGRHGAGGVRQPVHLRRGKSDPPPHLAGGGRPHDPAAPRRGGGGQPPHPAVRG